MKVFFITILTILIHQIAFSQQYKILESDEQKISIEFKFNSINYLIKDTVFEGAQAQFIQSPEFYPRNAGEPWLPATTISIGIPRNSNPVLTINRQESNTSPNKFIVPFPSEDPELNPGSRASVDPEIYVANKNFPENSAVVGADYIFRYSRIINLVVSPFQFNPVSRELVFHPVITFTIRFNDDKTKLTDYVDDNFTKEILKHQIINYKQAENWIGKDVQMSNNPLEGNYWYNPLKNYYKIYLKEKGVYRLSYEYLTGLNIPVQNISTTKFQIYYLGEEIPLFIKDINGNGIFESGDYIEFVGYPPKPSQYSGLNIYNLENVLWFSYEADSTGLRYTPKDAYPNNWVNSFQSVPNTIHYEVDSLYERLGHATNNQQDYWYWGKSTGRGGQLISGFVVPFPAPKNLVANAVSMTVTVNMFGMTFNNCNPDHKVKVFFTSQLIGEHTWDGPKPTTFQTEVDLTEINIFNSNNFQVFTEADLPPCPPDSIFTDEIRVNWFEFEYPMDLRADLNHIQFKNPPNVSGLSRIEVFNWFRDNMKIFVPEHNEMLINPQITINQYHSVFFVDDLNERVDYFCTSEDFFLTPDSVARDNSIGDLRNLMNGADYIIVTHHKFRSVAEQLASFRSLNFPDTTIPDPRIIIVDVSDIYDEFTFGLMDPEAIHLFFKYAFDNWAQPSPAYIVLLGDMSYDYRGLIPTSRPNFIPSMPYHGSPYGQAASDNLFVTVSGNGVIPDMAIGRLSCETVEEGDILLNKLMNYPSDPTKSWRQNALLISSGLSLNDELQFGFNNSHIYLDNTYIKPTGLSSTKIFRFPSDSSHLPFEGGNTEIRAGFNSGAVLASYYGHGGGYQWDLVFNNDDIYELENEGRLPFISSVTCYTAHFDNQDVFGEQFNKVPGKGSIAFWGSSGLTYWGAGRSANQYFFEEVYRDTIDIVGKAIITAKSRLGNVGGGSTQINLLTLLGDPVLKLALPDRPDFVVQSSSISIEPITPIVNQPLQIQAKINNFGRYFPNDSVTVHFLISSEDTSAVLADMKMGNFAHSDSLSLTWTPSKGGLYTLKIVVNEIDPIPEMDHSDNEASKLFAVFDLGEPSIVEPINGFVSDTNAVHFFLVDAGYYVNIKTNYLIEIDTTLNFDNPIIQSNLLTPANGLLKWDSPVLQDGKYFWRARVIVNGDSTVWNNPRVISVESGSTKKGYNIYEKSLISLSNYNTNYSDSLKSMILNTDTLPPRPSNNTFEEFIDVQLPPDILGLSNITTDGTYIYFAQDMRWVGEISKIYKMGTGFNGTTRGEIYGSIPNIDIPISNQMFYYSNGQNGYLYVPTGDAHSLLKIDPVTGDTSSVFIPDGMLNSSDGLVHDGTFYITSNGRYVYNIALKNQAGENKYSIRIFDPENNWNKLQNDIVPTGSSYENFKYFFVVKNYLYAYENYLEGYLRRINLTTGIYEEEWRALVPFEGFFAWTYDFVNNKVYASAYRGDFDPRFGVYDGAYIDANGNVASHQVGPASSWNSLQYDIDNSGSNGTFSTLLKGFNKTSRSWDTLFVNPANPQNLNSISSTEYPYLQFQVNMRDTSFGGGEPIQFKGMNIDYITPPELMITKDDILFDPDTLMQGFDTKLTTKVVNLGKVPADNVNLKYILSAPSASIHDSLLISKTINVPAEGQVELVDTLVTSRTIFSNYMQLLSEYSGNEFFGFNNLSENELFVARDSVRPFFNITFDGQQIIDGDIVSSTPEVIITLEDNSPLPLDTSFFTLVHTIGNTSFILHFSDPEVGYSYEPYPNSKSTITWHPELVDGRHTLEVLAKDSSGNFFDTTSYRVTFNVFSEEDLKEVYNYPNPFSTETHFTFQILGQVPEEFRIRIYTIAGRLIREISVPVTNLRIGFNKLFWDGRDQDGDDIANGLYLYKVIAKFPDETKSITQKLAKVQ